MEFDGKIDEKLHSDGSCGGFKHCKDRQYIPHNHECKECVEDYDEAMEDLSNMKIEYFY